MAVSFTKYQDEIIKAWRDVTDSAGVERWAMFGYEGVTNNIRLMSTGTNGLEELVKEFNCSQIQYAFCRVINKELGVNKLVLINWQGDSSPLSRKGLCASHVGDVTNYFKGCTTTITIRSDDEATKEYLMQLIVKTTSTRVQINSPPTNPSMEPNSTSSSSYTKADVRSEIPSDRKSFWQRQEEEEKERLIEEKKRAAERQATFERERKMKEETEAKKLAEAIKQRDRLIEATRQADQRSIQVNNSLSNDTHEDDGRVGRRSELIRLERNQETQSLIGKGSIKSKRAIFEQAQREQQNQPQPTLSRRTSGAMIAQRLNNFQSTDTSANHVSNSRSSANIEKLSNGFSKHVNIEDQESAKIAKEGNQEKGEEKQPVKDVSNVSIEGDNELISSEVSRNKLQEPNVTEPVKVEEAANDISSDLNGNDKVTKVDLELDEHILTNGNLGIKAQALYDYQAADDTEISFDPEDIIGQIQKVDTGWWHGVVVTGKYKNQKGLFPANYVQELP